MDHNVFTKAVEEKLKGLPRLARVGFSTRCAKRVEPLFVHHWPNAPQKHIDAVHSVIGFAQDNARGKISANTAAAFANTAYAGAADAMQAMLDDLDRLSGLAKEGDWKDDTPVPESFFESNLWPNGVPKGWPGLEPAGDAELVIEIEVPEGFTDEQVKQHVVELAKRADDYHRAQGGHGLKIEDVKIKREIPVPVPVGGSS